MLKLLAMTLAAATLSGCTSYFVRRDCAKIDWYKHGESVAMTGSRLTGNLQVRRCEEADAPIDYVALDQGFKHGMMTYCLPDSVRALGKRGEFFVEDMCDGENIRTLRALHKAGVGEFCQKANGYAVGASGKAYNQICPPELENDFKTEYNRGRKVYLTAHTKSLQDSIRDIDRSIQQLTQDRASVANELALLPSAKVLRHENVYDWVTKQTRDVVTVAEDPIIANQRNELVSRINGIDSEIANKREERDRLSEELRTASAELATLT